MNDIVKHLCSRENYTNKWQLTELVCETKFMNCPRGSRKDDYYINEEGMYELVFGSQQLNAKKPQEALLQCDVPTDSVAA